MSSERTPCGRDPAPHLFRRLCAVLLALSFAAKLLAQANSAAPGTGATALAAVPGAPAKSKALEQVKQVFGVDLAVAKSPQQKRTLGLNMLKAGTDTSNDPALKYSLLDTAKDL